MHNHPVGICLVVGISTALMVWPSAGRARSRRPGLLAPCRRGAVLPAGLPDSGQPTAAVDLDVSGIRPGC